MTKIYRIVFAVLAAMFITLSVPAQRFFSAGKPNAQVPTGGKREIFPEKFSATEMDFGAMKNFLWSLPVNRNFLAGRSNGQVLELPMPDGTVAKFRVWESSVQAPGLAAKFSEIRTFAGQGIDDPAANIRISMNPYTGFRAQILSPNGRVFIDPYAKGDVKNYISYFHRDTKRQANFSCHVEENLDNSPVVTAARADAACRGTQMYTYRLAVACTYQYAAAVGATNAAELHSAIVDAITRVNQVYESELSIHLELIDNNEIIEFLTNPDDPFTGNDDPGTLLAESQSIITSRIGSANFDIGHTFSTGGGGVAGLGVVCNTNNKARGITGSPVPLGDGYYIDYVAHEMGHQFGGRHTFNSVTWSCAPPNRNGTTAYEVGSGTTIQAYAGICTSDNIQPNSDPYFHAISFDEISNFVSGNGGTCAVITPTGNTLPVITSMENNNANIPMGTPFTLTGSATDADGDQLTYNWEQWDLGGPGAWNSGANTFDAPLFKSRVPKTSGSRTFPDIAVILANYPGSPAGTMGGLKGETLPTVGRDMKFRLTVRDNRAGGGGVVSGGSGCASGGFTGVFKVTTIEGTGPFVVSAPNGGESIPGGSTTTVTWSVANTNLPPINCANVKISMSTDGGLTYPTVLIASTANDGSEQVVLPGTMTTTARIKIEAVGNVFFDISNQNFNITAPVSGFDFATPGPVNVACAGPSTASVSLGTQSFSGFNTPIVLTALSHPPGTTLSFSPFQVVPGNAVNVTLNNTNTLSNGTYTVTVRGVAGAQTRDRILTFVVTTGAGPAITTAPDNRASCAGTNVSFNVVATGATAYQWQVSTDGGTNYADVALGGTSATYTINNINAAVNNNRYRVRVTGQCGVTVSAGALLTVQQPPVITTSPQSQTLCLGSNVTFTAAATGTAVGYQWQVMTPGGAFANIPGATNATYTINGITVGQSGNQYRAVVSGTCTPIANTTAATLTVISPVTVAADPESITQCETGNVSFTVQGAGTGILYKWQRSVDNGGSFQDVADGGVYAGATTPTLTLTNIPADFNNHQYRAVLSNATCTAPVPSDAATLTVNPRPTVTLAANPVNIQPGQETTISASIQPSATGFDISWFRNDQLIPGVNGTTYTADVTTLGSYRVAIVNEVTGCDNESALLAINASPSQRLFIFPSPSNGQFTVSYYNASASGRQTIAVYDSKGSRVYNGVLNLTGPYTLHPINLKGQGSGVFYVVLGDAEGKKIIEGKVLVTN